MEHAQLCKLERVVAPECQAFKGLIPWLYLCLIMEPVAFFSLLPQIMLQRCALLSQRVQTFLPSSYQRIHAPPALSTQSCSQQKPKAIIGYI